MMECDPALIVSCIYWVVVGHCNTTRQASICNFHPSPTRLGNSQQSQHSLRCSNVGVMLNNPGYR